MIIFTKEVVIGILVLLVLIAFGIYKLFFSNQEKFMEKKIIKFFGAEYCPYSNKESVAYSIMEDFENKYKDKVSVEYFTVEKDNDLMKKLNIQYIPTILNSKYESIELGLDKNVETLDKSKEELKDLLLENVYKKL